VTTRRTIQLADDLALPLEAITQTFGILAVRGAGKSNTAAVMAEGMYAAQLPFVVVDPVGSWWGLRAAGDGKKPGLALPIFGGLHGDVPLEQTAGTVLADLVVDDRLTCVLDVSDFSETAKTRFLLDFAERLYRRNRDPLHLFLEEADDYAPQRPMHEQARLLRAWENIVRRGRARGLGITMITQRSAALNKNVLTQIETLIVLRTTSPQDRKAIAGWVDYHGQAKDLLESLPGLGDGEAWVWSPSWLKQLERVKVHRRWTFDSAATPKDVRGARPPATLADVDLVAVRDRMAATIERAKQEDPKELRRQLAERDRRIRDLERAQPAPAPAKVERIEVPVLTGKQLQAFERGAARVEKTGTALVEVGGQFVTIARELLEVAKRAAGGNGKTPTRPSRPPVGISRPGRENAPGIRPRVKPDASRLTSGHLTRGPGAALPKGERTILTAVAQYPDGASRDQLSVLAGYKRSSRDTYLQRLREQGFVDQRGELLVATDAGVAALGDAFELLPTGEALQEYWRARLPTGERAILEVVLAAYPHAIERSAIDEHAGYKRSSRDTYLQRLASRRLVVTEGRGAVRGSEDLFG